jgi:hypothetical protein
MVIPPSGAGAVPGETQPSTPQPSFHELHIGGASGRIWAENPPIKALLRQGVVLALLAGKFAASEPWRGHYVDQVKGDLP